MSRRIWTKNENILVMDAYVSGVRKRKSDPRFLELCKLLDRTTDDSVEMRIANFKGIDPEHPRKGLTVTRQIREVWTKFADNRARLKSKAAAIRKRIKAKQSEKPGRLQKSKRKVSIAVAPEGKPLPRSHTVRERSSKLVREKKKSALRKTGRLFCEACGFDFVEKYGERGKGFIECHHTKPLRDLEPESRTRLSDLALLCSNCHRMIHAKEQWLEIKELVHLIKSAKRGGRARKNAPKRRQGQKTE